MARKREDPRAPQTPRVCYAATETLASKTPVCTFRPVITDEDAGARKTASEPAVGVPCAKTQVPSKTATTPTELSAAKATSGCSAFGLTTAPPTAETQAGLVSPAKENAGLSNEVSEPQGKARTTGCAETQAKIAISPRTETKTS